MHKQWHRDQTGHLSGRKTIPPGNRGTQCGTWNVDTELIKKWRSSELNSRRLVYEDYISLGTLGQPDEGRSKKDRDQVLEH
jgi:hypothetical protein